VTSVSLPDAERLRRALSTTSASPTGETFDLIATDEGLVEHPVPLQRIQLAPAKRAEIVVTFRPGEQVMLHSFAPDLHLSNFANSGGGGGGSVSLAYKIRSMSNPALIVHSVKTILLPNGPCVCPELR
jgi:FtsP/CotA-like multicopper oxidase with cupredoxin domain